MNLDEYVDLTDPEVDLERFSIESSGFNCRLKDDEGCLYKGFLLAKSEKGNALTVCDVSFEWSSTDHKYPPRLTFRRTYATLADRPVRDGQMFQRISFLSGDDGYRELWKMIGFLRKFKEFVDLGDFESKYQIVSTESVVGHLRVKPVGERKEEIASYVTKAGISEEEMAELLVHRARKNDVDTFKKLMDNKGGYVNQYRERHKSEIKKPGDEAVWHHFLKNHQWIFGLSLDLRFIEDLLDEQAVGDPDTQNKGNPMVDLLGLNDYTVLIELKTPGANIFTDSRSASSRANTWSFSGDFIDGLSQCLAQKTDWEKTSRSKILVKTDPQGVRRVLDQGVIRTIDPEAIYVVGNKDREVPRDSTDADVMLKRDTLERFSRNNRNITIIAYDELYRRAYHIAFGVPEPVQRDGVEEIFEPEPVGDPFLNDIDDLPF